MNPAETGFRLRKLRGKKTRVTVARETGISYSALSNYECGMRIPTDAHKIALARYYNTSVESLFFAESNHAE